MQNRAYRRSQLERMKQKALRLARSRAWDCSSLLDFERSQIKRANHLASCSCPMCGNPRKWFGERTRQEDLIDQFLLESAGDSD